MDRLGTALILLALAARAGVPSAVGAAASLASLTVPGSRLPAGCRLRPIAPDKSATPAGGTHVTRAEPFYYPSNPWSGTATRLLVQTQQKIDPPPPSVVDAPSTAADSDAIERERVRHIVEAYHALYDSADGSSVEVSAIEFDDPARALATPSVTNGMLNAPGAGGRIVKADVVVKLRGNAATDCFKAIDTYVRQSRLDGHRATAEN